MTYAIIEYPNYIYQEDGETRESLWLVYRAGRAWKLAWSLSEAKELCVL